MIRFKRIPAIILALALMLTCAQALSENAVTVYVARDGAKVYDLDGSVLGTLDQNDALSCTGVKKGVCRVEAKGRVGYMLKADLSMTPAAQTAAVSEPGKTLTAYVGRDGAKVYGARGKAVGSLSLNTQVTVTGVKGKVCRIRVDGRTGYMKKADLSDRRAETAQAAQTEAARTPAVSTAEIRADDISTATPATGSAREMDWWTSDIQNIFPRGAVAVITDVATGLAWREQRRGGTNHADVQPLTAADTAVLKKVYGGNWSWNRRAIFVTINGVNYAASMNGMPHDGGAIEDNDFDGHHCIHFTNSRTHGTDSVCEKHQAAIQKALSTTL